MLMLITPIRRLAEIANPITRAVAALERGLAMMDDVQAEKGGTLDPGRAKGNIELRDVTVAYRQDHSPALDHLSLNVAPGEIVALVGPSGSGKTTLVNLLMRFVMPRSGDVRLDGHDLTQWDLAALRSQFAMVSQDVVMFNDTVAANVALGQAIDRDRVNACLEAANLSEHIAALPEGMDTIVGHNATQLSGGQRQRLAIARALVQGRTDPDPGRSHVRTGHRVRAPGPAGSPTPDGGPHHPDHCPPAVHHRACGPRRGHGTGSHHAEQGSHEELMAMPMACMHGCKAMAHSPPNRLTGTTPAE
jgi:ABC-type iron transport system FetAB ATPase subunit